MSQDLLPRLISQLKADGVKNAESEARALLISRGQMDHDGKLTALGLKRQAMGPDGRAIDRAVKGSGGRHKASDYVYDKKTNQARLK